jgi:hypothetical protein
VISDCELHHAFAKLHLPIGSFSAGGSFQSLAAIRNPIYVKVFLIVIAGVQQLRTSRSQSKLEILCSLNFRSHQRARDILSLRAVS